MVAHSPFEIETKPLGSEGCSGLHGAHGAHGTQNLEGVSRAGPSGLRTPGGKQTHPWVSLSPGGM